MARIEPRDGLRSKCPHFDERTNYRRKYFLRCGSDTLCFRTREEREAWYRAVCCGDWRKCERAEKREEREE